MPNSPTSALSPSLATANHGSIRRGIDVVTALIVLTKPRLAFFSILTAMASYAAARPLLGSVHAWLTLLGTTLAAGGALSLNQWWERRTDAMMKRTRGRPLPREVISPEVALVWSLSLGIFGTGLLAWKINVLAATIGAATILIYGVVYTPLKRRTRWATEIGSISGALPPLLGTAAAGDITLAPGWILAAVLVFWQMPHFFAIGWMYRTDYRAAGFPLLPAVDRTGGRTADWSLGYTIALVLVSLIPWALGHVGAIYGVPAVIAGVVFLQKAARFARATDGSGRDMAARRLFLGSIIYLPLVMGALFVDRMWGS